jgi:cell division septum initiation protein DivIVA
MDQKRIVIIDEQLIAAIQQEVAEMPRAEGPRQTTKTEAVRMLKPAILEMLKKGYSYKQVADYLKGKGLPISSVTIAKEVPSKKTMAKTKMSVKKLVEGNKSGSETLAEDASAAHTIPLEDEEV